MGKTSPNNKIKKVTKITSTANFKTEDVIVEKTSSRENENKITIAMCKKLNNYNKENLCNDEYIE